MPRIRLIEEYEAQGQVAEIYKDIKRSLKVPLVSSFFKMLAFYPDFLDTFWNAIKPNTGTHFAVSAARTVRNLAESQVGPLFEYVDDYAWLKEHGFSREDMREIRYAVEMFHYVLPIISLMAAHLKLALDQEQFTPREKTISEKIEPDFSSKVQIVRVHSAPKEVEYIYLDIMDTTRLPMVNTIYQVLGHWPKYLQHVWYDEVKPVILTNDFERETDKLRSTIDDLARQFPYPFSVSKEHLPEESRDQLVKIAALYNKMTPRLCVVASAVRRMLLEGERAARSGSEHLERSV